MTFRAVAPSVSRWVWPQRGTQAGRDVTILCGSLEGGLRETLDSGVKVEELDPPVRRGLFSRRRLGRAMGRRVAVLRPDVIFLPGNFHALLANALRKADPHPAIVLKISNPPVPGGVPFAKAVFRHITRAVDGFAAMNSGLARELTTLLPGRNIVTLHDPAYVRSHVATSRHRRHHNILWIGRLESQKDPFLALKTLQALGASAHLTMLGEGSLRADIEHQVAVLKLKDRVRLAGHVHEIESYLASADALLITSRYEGGPAVAVEALAHGRAGGQHRLFLSFERSAQDTGKRQDRCLPRSGRSGGGACRRFVPKPVPRRDCGRWRSPFEPQARAKAYLDWFDSLVAHG